MTAATLKAPETTELKPILYSVTEATINAQADKYLGLTISGIDDRKGYEAVRSARMDCVHARNAIERTRKQLKADSLEYGRKVDAEAKRLVQLIEPIEAYLETTQDSIDAQRKRIEEKRRFDLRTERLKESEEKGVFEFVRNFEIEDMTPEKWQQCLADAVAEAEVERINKEEKAAEEKRRQEEAAKLAAERAELDRQKAELDQQRAELKRQQDEAQRQADEAARVQREADEAAQRAAQAEQARLKAEQAESERRARLEATRPDREKLLAVADTVSLIEVPDVSEPSQDVAIEIRTLLSRTSDAIKRLVERLGN